MDLQETWKKLESEKLCQPISGTTVMGNGSKHPLLKLKETYKMSTGFIFFFLVCFTILFFLFQEPLVKGSLLLLTAFYLFGLCANVITIKKLQLNMTLDQNTKSVLEHTYFSVSHNVRFQERFSLLFYPVAGVAGFFMGIATMSNNFNSLIREKYVLLILFASLIIMIPLCYLITKQMHKRAYGKSLEELKKLITELDNPE